MLFVGHTDCGIDGEQMSIYQKWRKKQSIFKPQRAISTHEMFTIKWRYPVTRGFFTCHMMDSAVAKNVSRIHDY